MRDKTVLVFCLFPTFLCMITITCFQLDGSVWKPSVGGSPPNVSACVVHSVTYDGVDDYTLTYEYQACEDNLHAMCQRPGKYNTKRHHTPHLGQFFTLSATGVCHHASCFTLVLDRPSLLWGTIFNQSVDVGVEPVEGIEISDLLLRGTGPSMHWGNKGEHASHPDKIPDSCTCSTDPRHILMENCSSSPSPIIRRISNPVLTSQSHVADNNSRHCPRCGVWLP